MDPLTIRFAAIDDAAPLAVLARVTFDEAFGHLCDPHDMRLYMDEAFAPAQLAREIADPQCSFLLAFCNRDMVGYLKLRTGYLPPCVTGPDPIELCRLYVPRALHGRGVAARLMDDSLQLARDKGHRTMWLGVWDRNHRAQAFYRKYGFAQVGEHPFQLGNDAQTDMVWARPL